MFSFEMSMAGPFWNFKMLWYTFITCAFAVLVLALMQGIVEDGNLGFRGATLKFAKVDVGAQSNTSVVTLGAVVIGIVGGCMGAFFININFRMNAIRKRLLTVNWIKPVETMLWCFVTSSAFFWTAFLMYYSNFDDSCKMLPKDIDED